MNNLKKYGDLSSGRIKRKRKKQILAEACAEYIPKIDRAIL